MQLLSWPTLSAAPGCAALVKPCSLQLLTSNTHWFKPEYPDLEHSTGSGKLPGSTLTQYTSSVKHEKENVEKRLNGSGMAEETLLVYLLVFT